MTEPESVDSSEEEQAEFICEAGGVPKPDIVWSINGEPIQGTVKKKRQLVRSVLSKLPFVKVLDEMH